MAENYDEWKKEDLIELITKLNEDNDNLENEVSDLHKELLVVSKKAKKSNNGNNDIDSDLDGRLEELQDQLTEADSEIARLKEALTDTNASKSIISKEKQELDIKCKEQAKKIDELEKDLLQTLSKAREAERASKEMQKNKGDSVRETKKLFDENEQLQQENKQMLDQLRTQKAKMDEYELAITELHDKNEDLEVKFESSDLKLNELLQRIHELEKLNEEAQDKLAVANDAEGQWEIQLNEIKKEFKLKIDSITSELKASKAENSNLSKQILLLKDSTVVGEKQRQIDILTSEHDEVLKLLDEKTQELNIVSADKIKLGEYLADLERKLDQKVAERVVLEKEKVKNLQAALLSKESSHATEIERYKDMEVEKNALVREVDELNHWKAIYENGHGLRELARNQKRLKDENRSLGVLVEHITNDKNILTDKVNLIEKAFEKLCIESGKPADFMYPQYELEDEIVGDYARMKAQINELEEQIGALETDNTRLRKALKNQAGSIGEQGFKYAGMSPDMLIKVNEFAANLRDGNLTLPIDDRSSELLKANKRLRDEIRGLNLQVERYERELGGGLSNTNNSIVTQGATAKVQETELFGLREDMRRLAKENAELHNRFTTMQAEMMLAIRSHLSGGDISARSEGKSGKAERKETNLSSLANTDDIAAILLANNDLLMRELQELKATSAHMLAINEKANTLGRPQLLTRGSIPFEQNISELPPTGKKAGLSTPKPVANENYSYTPHQSLPYTPLQPNGPTTPHGKQLLVKNISQLNLPPEEWTEDVKDLNGQLVECLEQLYEREEELEEQRGTISELENSLVTIKQQVASLYHDFAVKMDTWDEREKQYKRDNAVLHDEQDDLRLKLKRTQEIIDVIQKDDKDSIEAKLLELNRKATIYEVNEAVLARKFVSQQEQMEQDQQMRKRLEIDFAEMEATLKKRILFLEQYKSTASSRIAYLQGALDSSVPQVDYLALQTELDNLREDHLLALRREVDVRVTALKTYELSSELQVLRLNSIQLQAELTSAKKASKTSQLQLNQEKELTTRALAAANSSAELSSIISEMASFRGEASRLEVELSASNRRYELSAQEMQRAIAEKVEMLKKLQEMEAREEEAEKREAEARKMATEIVLKYEGGCDRLQASELKSKIEKMTRDLDEAQRETARHRELAEISSLQAQSIGFYRQQHEEELKSLREYCTKLESRGDDEILIGRLQRQLMSTKTSYKAFVRKYQILRGNMRQRELAMRVLETRLDQRDEAVFKMNETHRFEISALKKALRNLSEIVDPSTDAAKQSQKKDRSDRKVMTIGQKLLSFSQKVSDLAAKAEESISKSVVAVEDSRRYQGIAEDAILERDLLSQRNQDLESLTKGNIKQNNIATRLVALSEEVRLNKLSVMQQRRQIQVLKEEKRHLQSLISTMEADVEDLEEGKVLAETKNLLGDSTNRNDEISKAKEKIEKIDAVIEDYKSFNKNFLSLSATQSATMNSDNKSLKVSDSELMTPVDENDDFKENLVPEDYIKKIQVLHDQLKVSRKSASENKLLSDRLNSQINDLQVMLKEKQSQLSYYEKMASSESLGKDGVKYDMNHKQVRMMRDEQEKLQEAANATIGSLRALLDEKNRTIDKYRQKLETQALDKKVKSQADLKADKLLEKLNYEHQGEHPNDKFSKNPPIYDNNGSHNQDHNKLLEQIRHADELLQDKDHLMTQLEQKLAVQNNQRERAEVRCGASIKEMEAMKNDMITLAKQLQLSEERCNLLAKSSVGSVKVPNTGDESKQLQKLQNVVKVKDEKLKSYREIIVRLKDEFIKVEEERAVEAVTNSKSKDMNSNNNQSIGAEDMRELRSQIAALRDGLKKAKEELESARKNREKLSQARQAAQEEAERLETQVGRAEAQASSAQESLQRCRKELEEARKKEVRLRDKVKELMENMQNQNDIKGSNNIEAGSKIEKLQIEIEVLKAQNQALRKASENEQNAKARDGEIQYDKGQGIDIKVSKPGVTEEVKFTTKGNTLGASAPAGEGGPVDELRQMQHSKWEAEKKLLKRLSTLEKRLQEKIDENGELQAQLKRAREQIQATSAAKEEFQKKAAAAIKTNQDSKKHSADDVTGLEELQSKIFKLEEDNTVLRRRVEVELASEMAMMKQQLAEARKREDQLKIELEESEELRKRAASGPGGRTLRDSEDRFMREERLKDELTQARQQRLELESALLERDSRAMEHRFDLEAREQEVIRLKRRNKELEAAYRNVSQLGGGNKNEAFGSPSGVKTAWTEEGERGAGARFNRERDLEGVVEAMKRVVDKLKTENDRLRKGGGPDERKAGEAEKKAAEQKKRADKLDEEMKSLQAKLKGYEESGQKLIQRQQQVTALRKQLKTREDELIAFRDQSQSVVIERDDLKKKLASAEMRIEQLESSIQQSSNKNNRGDNINQLQQKEISDLKRKLLEQAVELEKTKEKLVDTIRLGEKSLKDNKSSLDTATASNNNIEIKRLKEENERLRQELSAFDLDFFEEIENLKFAHAEAIRKLKVYEASSKR